MLEFVDSGLYFVQDENNFINPLLQAGSGSGWPKINGSDRIIPGSLASIKKNEECRI